MKTCWWQDKIDDYQQWHSLLVRVTRQRRKKSYPQIWIWFLFRIKAVQCPVLSRIPSAVITPFLPKTVKKEAIFTSLPFYSKRITASAVRNNYPAEPGLCIKNPENWLPTYRDHFTPCYFYFLIFVLFPADRYKWYLSAGNDKPRIVIVYL